MVDAETVGAVVGRFQIDELHEGHRALLDFVTAKHKRVVVLVGVRSINPDNKHPLSFEVRRNMIQKAYPDVLVLPIQDQKSDRTWSTKVDSLLSISVGLYPVQFYAGRDGFAESYHGNHDVKVMNLIPEDTATERRTEIKHSATELDSPSFRAGVIHGVMNRYPTVEATVDMAIFNSDSEIVLGRKDGETEWRLPGGFVNGPERLEIAATREAQEETGLSVDATGWEYAGNFDVDDWRVRGTDDHFIRTVLFISWGSHFGVLKPGDDLAEVEWVSLDALASRGRRPIVKGHHALIDRVLDKWNSKPRDGEVG